jgi:hypothetical protein
VLGVESNDLRSQLQFLLLGVSCRRTAVPCEGRLEDGLSLGRTLAKQRVTIEIVLFCRGRGAQLYEIVLEVTEVSHDLRNSHSAGIVDCEAKLANSAHYAVASSKGRWDG